jgi:hypothetical protein
MIGMLVMETVDDDPTGRRLLQVANAKNGEAVFKP